MEEIHEIGLATDLPAGRCLSPQITRINKNQIHKNAVFFLSSVLLLLLKRVRKIRVYLYSPSLIKKAAVKLLYKNFMQRGLLCFSHNFFHFGDHPLHHAFNTGFQSDHGRRATTAASLHG